MTIPIADLNEFRALVARMEQLLEVPSTLAATKPDGTPGNVASGELIESAWGNAVANTVARLNGGGATGGGRLLVQGSRASVVTSDAFGNALISFPQAFGTTVPVVVANNSNSGLAVVMNAFNSTQINFQVNFRDYAGNPVANSSQQVQWIAVGIY